MTLIARDAMTAGVKSVRSDVSIPDLERRLNDERVDGYAVVDDEVFRGEVSKSDILRQLDTARSEAEMATGFWSSGDGVDAPLPAADWVSAIIGKYMDHLHVSDVMNHAALTTKPDTPLVDVARQLLERDADRVFVIEDRRLVGVITPFDFLRLYAEARIVDPN